MNNVLRTLPRHTRLRGGARGARYVVPNTRYENEAAGEKHLCVLRPQNWGEESAQTLSVLDVDGYTRRKDGLM